MQKKLLILGANAETTVLVNTAKEMGIYTIVTDNIPNAHAKQYADKSFDIDGMNLDELEKMAREEKVDGVLVGTADPLIRPYFELCNRLDLPCFANEMSSRVLTNKTIFKEEAKKYGIEGIPEYSYEDVMNDNVKYPILVKPSDGRSGKGISVCNSKEEVDEAISFALQHSNCKNYIIERFMQCDDAFVYFTFQDGNVYLSAMADRYTSREQENMDPVVLGAVYPSKYLDWYMDKIHPKMIQLFKGLSIKNGVLLVQAFVEDGHFYIYDPGFRLQGGAPHILIDAINHFDHRKMLIELAISGKTTSINVAEMNDPTFHGIIAGSQTVLLKKGVIKKIRGIEEVSKFNQVVLVTQRLYENDEVSMIGTEQQILVRFHLVCKDMQEFRETIEKINRTIQVLDENGENMCLKGLAI